MKSLRTLTGALGLGGILAVSSLAFAADQAPASDAKAAKPYPLKTCIVSGEKLEGGMGKSYVFVENGQEIKLCCKDCLKDFRKDPSKYLKKLAKASKDTKGDAASAGSGQEHAGHQH